MVIVAAWLVMFSAFVGSVIYGGDLTFVAASAVCLGLATVSLRN
jgi:hypothetical protein